MLLWYLNAIFLFAWILNFLHFNLSYYLSIGLLFLLRISNLAFNTSLERTHWSRFCRILLWTCWHWEYNTFTTLWCEEAELHVLWLERCLNWSFLFVIWNYEIYFHEILFNYAQLLRDTLGFCHRLIVSLIRNDVYSYLRILSILSGLHPNFPLSF